MAVQTDKLKRMFDSDSKLMLETLRQLVGEMTQGTADPQKIDRAFRAAHSIKSEAGFLELSGVADAAHNLEESLANLRSGVQGAGAGVPSRLADEFSVLSRRIGEYHASQPIPEQKQSGNDADLPVTESLGSAETGMLREARGRSERLFRVGLQLTCDPDFYYPRGFLAVNNLEIECAVVQISPTLEALKGGGDGHLSILLTCSGDEALLHRALTVDDLVVTEITELAFTEIEQAGQEIDADADAKSGPGPETDSRMHEELMLFVDELGQIARELEGLTSEGGMANEKLRSVSQRLSAVTGVLKTRADRASRVQLLDAVRSLRDRSAAHAARHGKRIRFVVSGGGAVVFSAVADTLTDALLHLIRNSIDHGIGTIERRAMHGKPPAGTIQISVDRLGESIRIRVGDDGDGIDEAALRRESGDSQQELLDILAAPGFTMRSEADQSSGRGVGLDTVVHIVRDLLSGGIELTSSAGKGTVVNISIPASSRLMDVLVVDSSDGTVALPSSLVVDHQPLSLRRFKRDSFGARYYDYRGKNLPLLTVFGRDPGDDAFGSEPIGVVVRCGAELAVLLASRIIASEAVVRDDVKRKSVFCRTLGREVPLVLPSICTGE